MARLYIDVRSGLSVNAEIYNQLGDTDLDIPGLTFDVPDELWDNYKQKFTEFHDAEKSILDHAGLKVQNKGW